ncbi:MAG: LPS-assembly protein LptD [Mangrovicoccus sp.]|nr:LPS-assembly protein LptD [Mangrovicoccus sp.]
MAMRTSSRRLASALLAGLALAVPAALIPAGLAAQEAEAEMTTLVADMVRIDGENVLVAEGNVEVYSRGARLRASRLVYDRVQDRLWIDGPIELQNPDGTVLLADAAELDPDLTEGILTGARVILNEQLQIAGSEAVRRQDRYTDLKRVVASSCEVCDGGGPPLWEIRASRVIHDQAEHQIYFYNARFRIAGIPVFYLPNLRIPDGTIPRVRGFLTPSFYYTNQLGNGIKLPYFIPLGDHADLTVTPYVAERYSNTLIGRYRQAFVNGDLEIDGAISRDSILPDQTRGYAFVNGKFALPNDYLLGFTLEGVSDNAYLQDYDFSEQDFLTNAVGILKTEQNERIEADLIAYQSLRGDIDTSRRFDYQADGRWDKRQDAGVLGGWFDTNFVGHAHQINARPTGVSLDGDELGQFRATGGWTRNWTGPVGLRFNAAGRLNADMVQVNDDPTYPEFQSALTPQMAATLSWPLFKATGNGIKHLLEPVAQLAWTAEDTLDLPNVDSTEVALDSGNLLALNRFPGLNAYEEGARANLALRWTRYNPAAWTYGLTAGQVVQFTVTDQFDLSPNLSGRTSSWLSQIDIGYTDRLALRSVVLMDSSLQLTSNETRVSVNAWNLLLSSNYVWQSAEASNTLTEDLSALGAAATYVLNDTWSSSVEVRQDFTADKTTYSEVGVGYQNECVRVDLSLVQKFRATSDEEPITSYQFSVELAGFGSGANAVRRGRCTNGG